MEGFSSGGGDIFNDLPLPTAFIVLILPDSYNFAIPANFGLPPYSFIGTMASTFLTSLSR
jgi:hypothetical protein